MKQTKSTSMIVAVTAIVLAVMGLFLVYGNFNSKSINRISRAKVAHTATTTGSALEVQASSNSRYIKWRKVKVYSQKSESSSVVQILRRDAKVRILSNENGVWARIKTSNGKEGYILKSQLTTAKVKTRTRKAAEKEWRILGPALTENGWEITDDNGYKYYSGRPGWVRMIWARKGNGESTYTFNIQSSSIAGIRGGVRTTYMFWVFRDGTKIAQSPFSEDTGRESVLEQINKY